MITLLLWALAISLVVVVVYLIGRLAYDAVQVFRTRAESESRTVLWRDVGVVGIVVQIVTLALVAATASFLWSNFQARTSQIGLDLSFDFLSQPGNISIADNPLIPNASVGEAIKQGFFNTIRIILVGIPLSMLLGTIVGVARFSSNWIVRKLATGYVEFFRNIPVLVVIVFLWGAVFLQFPAAKDAWKPLDSWLIFSNNRFSFPSFMGLENFAIFRWLLLASLLLAFGVAVWRTNVFNKTGTPHHRVLWGVGTFVALTALAYFALDGPITTSKPELDDRGRVFSNGIRMQMPYVALTLGLVIYTATHIAEIVRGSILAIHKGQDEAANALALSTLQKYRFIILPQAMRVGFPPLINQFLNFSKNSSLAIAIGFTETTSIIQNLSGQSRPAPQLILILALLYLTLSLIISAFGNLINRRLQIVGK